MEDSRKLDYWFSAWIQIVTKRNPPTWQLSVNCLRYDRWTTSCLDRHDSRCPTYRISTNGAIELPKIFSTIKPTISWWQLSCHCCLSSTIRCKRYQAFARLSLSLRLLSSSIQIKSKGSHSMRNSPDPPDGCISAVSWLQSDLFYIYSNPSCMWRCWFCFHSVWHSSMHRFVCEICATSCRMWLTRNCATHRWASFLRRWV